MNHRGIRAVMRKDLTVVRRSRAMMLPMVVVPFILLIALPAGLSLGPALAARSPHGEAKLRDMLDDLPPPVRDLLAGYPPQEAWILLVNEHLLPALFLIVPFMVSSVIAADSFAGERERRTLEALLYTPLSDAELLLGKLLASWIPAVLVGFAGLAAYSATANAVAWPIMHRIFVPTAAWVVLVAWVAPAVALAGLAGMILVSLRVRGTQEAMQLGGLLVLPVLALVVAQIRGIVVMGPGVMFAIGLLVWLLGGALLAFGARAFRRTSLVTRL